MVEYGGKYHVTLSAYHGVPPGWGASEIIAEHQRLGGTFNLLGPKATEPGAPAWLPDRENWLQYRAMVRRVSEGVRANDPACIELAVRYIVLRYIGSYSGFLRAHLSRSLKRAALTAVQKQRLIEHFLSLVEKDERTEEFREYTKLWRKLTSDPELSQIEAKVSKMPNGQVKAVWLLTQLRPNELAQHRSARTGRLRRPAG